MIYLGEDWRAQAAWKHGNRNTETLVAAEAHSAVLWPTPCFERELFITSRLFHVYYTAPSCQHSSKHSRHWTHHNWNRTSTFFSSSPFKFCFVVLKRGLPRFFLVCFWNKTTTENLRTYMHVLYLASSTNTKENNSKINYYAIRTGWMQS